MVKNPSPTQLPTPPGFPCRFGASWNVILRTNPDRAAPTA
jgi:hypothetical protein